MKLSEVSGVYVGRRVRLTAPGMQIEGTLTEVDIDTDEYYVEDVSLDGTRTTHVVRSEPTISLTVGGWVSPTYDLEDETTEVEVL